MNEIVMMDFNVGVRGTCRHVSVDGTLWYFGSLLWILDFSNSSQERHMTMSRDERCGILRRWVWILNFGVMTGNDRHGNLRLNS